MSYFGMLAAGSLLMTIGIGMFRYKKPLTATGTVLCCHGLWLVLAAR